MYSVRSTGSSRRFRLGVPSRTLGLSSKSRGPIESAEISDRDCCLSQVYKRLRVTTDETHGKTQSRPSELSKHVSGPTEDPESLIAIFGDCRQFPQ